MRDNLSPESTDPFANAWQAVAKIPEIQMATCQKLMRSQGDWITLWMEYGSKQLQALDGRRDPRDNLMTQSELVSAYSSKLFDCAVELFDIVAEANTELMECIGPHETRAAAEAADAGRMIPAQKSRRAAESSAAAA